MRKREKIYIYRRYYRQSTDSEPKADRESADMSAVTADCRLTVGFRGKYTRSD